MACRTVNVTGSTLCLIETRELVNSQIAHENCFSKTYTDRKTNTVTFSKCIHLILPTSAPLVF